MVHLTLNWIFVKLCCARMLLNFQSNYWNGSEITEIGLTPLNTEVGFFWVGSSVEVKKALLKSISYEHNSFIFVGHRYLGANRDLAMAHSRASGPQPKMNCPGLTPSWDQLHARQIGPYTLSLILVVIIIKRMIITKMMGVLMEIMMSTLIILSIVLSWF